MRKFQAIRKTRRLSPILLLLCVVALGQETVFRADVKLVRILAVVKNTTGELVGGLGKEDFSVYDNGAKQELAIFERRTEQPLSVALMVDTSLSTAKDLDYEIQSVARFFRAMFAEGNPQDTVALYTFNYEVNLIAAFTSRRARLEDGLKRLKSEGGTSLYDAVYLASRDLADREGRKVMVVVTDGGDTTSAKDFHAALESAQMADAVLYAILVVPITNDAGRNIGGEHALALLTSGTGGRVFTPSVGATLDSAFLDILKELRTQYFLAYYPKNVPASRNRFHRLEVKLRDAGLRALARSGYYGESEPK
jgi:Ca-activated chloride channel family protein